MVTLNLSDFSGTRLRRRPKTLSQRSLKRERPRNLLTIIDDERPVTREECRNGPRPCLYVSCKFHLYLDVNPENGAIKLNFPHLEPWEMTESCALDVAERGGMSLEELGKLLNVTRERARQLEESGKRKIAEKL
jgi:hypothetical protein